MTEEIKKAIETAEQEFQKEKESEQIKAVKEIVQKTLEKIDEIDKEIKELEEEKRILRLDIDDMKSGKLNLIAERQKKDDRARNTSIVIIKEKEVIRNYPYWTRPYEIMWQSDDSWGNNVTYCQNTTSTTLSNGMTINCSVVKDNAIGAYMVHNKIVNLR